MKLPYKLFTVVFLSFILLSCSGNKPVEKDGFTTITGSIDIPYVTEVTLSKVEHGKSFLVSSSQLNSKNQFGFSISPDKEGFFILGDSNRNIEIPIYVKGNQTLTLEYNDDGYKLLNIPDVENEVLYDWIKATDTLETFSFRKGMTTYKDFFPFYEKFLPKMEEYHDAINTPNQRFNELMHAYIDLKAEEVALMFLFTPRSIHPEYKDHPSFYKNFMKGDNFKSDIILDVPGGISTLRMHQQYKYTYGQNESEKLDYRTEVFKDTENDKLRAHLALEFLPTFKSYNSEYLSFIEPLRDDIKLSEYVTKEVDDYEVTIKSLAEGTEGYPFTYKNEKGEEVSFSDFKGKFVYIDVWATWCAPCKAEAPYFKQLYKDFQGKDILFVSISLDKQEDHGKWKEQIIEEEMVGIQLFSDDAFNTRIAKDYKINGIPRFLLFDKEGKIIDANAKRPSNPELKKQLLNLVN